MASADEGCPPDTDSGTQQNREESLRERFRRLGPVMSEAGLEALEALADLP